MKSVRLFFVSRPKWTRVIIMDHKKQFKRHIHSNQLLDLENVLEEHGIASFELLTLCRRPESEAVSKLSQKISIAPDKTRSLLRELRELLTNYYDRETSPVEIKEKIPTGLQTIDSNLAGGIFVGAITEVFGSSGCGKSQFLLQTALQAQLQRNSYDVSGKCIYISTESAIETRRLSEMMNNSILIPKNALENIAYIYCQDGESQDHILFTQLPLKLKMSQENNENVRLVIIDSVGHHFRLEDSFINNLAYLKSYLKQQEKQLEVIPSYLRVKLNFEALTNKFFRSHSSYKKRSLKRLYLLDLYRHLNQLARSYNVAFLIANQVSDIFEDSHYNKEKYFEDSNPLCYTEQVGSFSGWTQSIIESEAGSSTHGSHPNLKEKDGLYVQRKRRKLFSDINTAMLHKISLPPRKVSALGYTWAKLVSNKILLWKVYTPRFYPQHLIVDDDLTLESSPRNGNLSSSDMSDYIEEWSTNRFAKVVSPVSLSNTGNSTHAIPFSISVPGLLEVSSLGPMH